MARIPKGQGGKGGGGGRIKRHHGKGKGTGSQQSHLSMLPKAARRRLEEQRAAAEKAVQQTEGTRLAADRLAEKSVRELDSIKRALEKRKVELVRQHVENVMDPEVKRELDRVREKLVDAKGAIHLKLREMGK